MSNEQQYQASEAKQDLGGILSQLNNLKQKLELLDGLTEDIKAQFSKASEDLNGVLNFIEFVKQESEAVEKEEFMQNDQKLLTKEDKTMPKPTEGETFEQFMTRCMYDTNARTIYAEDQTRFKACMLQSRGENFRDS